MIFWGRETARCGVRPCRVVDGCIRLSHSIGKCAIGRSGNVRSGDREMCDRANSSCNSVNFTRYRKLGHRRNSDTAVPFPYELGGGYMRLCAKKFGHG
ncbi:hypothetical protein, partial [Microcoleus sp. herbarium2]|uniref:hypothetical protein n=1 Tax=Microcoleus sp. herbarium2 TaxID=3055433 RepID=UPI002FD19D94